MVEQNAREALEIATRAYILVDGRNSRTGPAPELAANPDIRRLFLGALNDKGRLSMTRLTRRSILATAAALTMAPAIGHAAETLRLGVLTPLTGAGGFDGPRMLKAMKAVTDEVNRRRRPSSASRSGFRRRGRRNQPRGRRPRRPQD